MLIGITYNRSSNMVMRLNFTENAAEEANLRAGLLCLGGPIPATQAVAVVDGTALGVHAALADVITAAQKQLGVSLLPPAVCAIIDPNMNLVVDSCRGDPAHYQPPGKLMAAAAAGVGWAYDPLAKTLTAPIEIDPKTLQPLTQTVLAVAPAIASVDAPL